MRLSPSLLRAGAAGLACLAACSVPEQKFLADSSPPGEPFACHNQPLPTTAEPQITATGTVIAPFTGNVVAGATVQGFLVGTPVALFTVTTDAAGMFSQDQGTGGVPRDAFLKVTASGYADSYYHPAVPLTTDFDAQIQQLTPADVMTMAAFGEFSIDAGTGHVFIGVIDCNGAPIRGATVSTSPPGTLRYLYQAMPSASAVATDESGVALVANLPPGPVTIEAMIDGRLLRSHTLELAAESIAQAEIQP